MSRRFLAVVIVGFLAVLLAGGTFARRLEGRNQREAVRLGEHLVTIAGCHDCHTPWVDGPEGPAPDMSRALSGHPESLGRLDPVQLPSGEWGWAGCNTNTAYSGPWGVSYTANLTPDEVTGLGIWTEDMFIQAIRTGRHMGVSRPINPPMPWPAYRNMTDKELKAIFAYLRSLPPIRNQVPLYLEPHMLEAGTTDAAAAEQTAHAAPTAG